MAKSQSPDNPMGEESSAPNFEQSLQSLEALVTQMESGELSLEASLKAYEQGVKLTQICQQALQNAEQRVALLQPDGSEADFVPAEND